MVLEGSSLWHLSARMVDVRGFRESLHVKPMWAAVNIMVARALLRRQT